MKSSSSLQSELCIDWCACVKVFNKYNPNGPRPVLMNVVAPLVNLSWADPG